MRTRLPTWRSIGFGTFFTQRLSYCTVTKQGAFAAKAGTDSLIRLELSLELPCVIVLIVGSCQIAKLLCPGHRVQHGAS